MQHRVLHIISGMNRGGIETWIMNVLRRIDTAAIRFDFLVEAQEPCSYDEEIERRGGRILRAPRFRHRGRFVRRLLEVLRHEGPYDVVHAHGRHNMALPLAIASAMGVPVRIGHVHNVTDRYGTDPLRRAYKAAMKRVLFDRATWILGCSTTAVESLYGPGSVHAHAKLEMLPYGIDLARFVRQPSRARVEQEFGIAPGSRIAGHVGRFVWEKNHAFLLDVIEELARRDPRWVLLLVGDGPLRAEIEAKIADRKLGAHVRFTGVRDDVPALMSAMDVFVFPSHQEGFGLVLVEAQALGLPCVINRNLPGDVDVLAPLVQRLDLGAGAGTWADAIVRAAESPVRAEDAHAAVAESHFNIDRSVERLLGRYYHFDAAR